MSVQVWSGVNRLPFLKEHDTERCETFRSFNCCCLLRTVETPFHARTGRSVALARAVAPCPRREGAVAWRNLSINKQPTLLRIA